MTPLTVSLIVLSALVAGWPRATARRRLRRICGSNRPRRARHPDLYRWAPVAVGLSVALVVDGWSGVAAGLVGGIVLHHLLRRLETRSARQRRLSAASALPFAVDLLAASVRAGAPPSVASRTVGTALDGPLGGRLCRVADALALGAPPVEAWAHLDGVPGAGRLVLAAVRSSESGAALAGALTRLADELRAARVTACEAAARRAGVLVVLPLGLCFLPAFVLAGLVPIVLSVLGEVIR
ncbi:MAG TPA: type II secretion system F family protein [Micromonosporaceae bacterium]